MTPIVSSFVLSVPVCIFAEMNEHIDANIKKTIAIPMIFNSLCIHCSNVGDETT